MFTTRQSFAAGAAVLVALLSCGCNDVPVEKPTKTAKVEATDAGVGAGIVGIEADDFGSNVAISTDWIPGEALGVYTQGSKNLKYTNGTSGKTVEFSTTTKMTENPQVAYYPYSTANSGRDYSSLRGNVPASVVPAGDKVQGIHKYGENRGSYTDGTMFTFHTITAIAQIKVDAAGTELEGETLKSLTVKATRNGKKVEFVGDFVFNGAEGSYLLTTSTTNELKLNWEVALAGVQRCAVALLPEIKAGDELSFEVVTSGHKATYSSKAAIDFKSAGCYILPLALAKFEIEKIGGESGGETGGEGKSGQFTCATYNVDGLPKKIAFVTVNPDGPGTEGTKKMAAKITADNWDFFGVSEDFTNHSTLVSGLPEFTFGTYGGNYSKSSTDGINLAWRSGKGVKAENETRIKFDKSYGGLTAGANTSITKGFRYYLVTLEDGTQIDVYITHMNTYSSSGSGHINAQHAQLSQLASYIISHRNGRPVILMGDTNLRYTRHKIKELFIDTINAVDGLTVADPWIEYPRAGVYPDYPGKSIMAYPTTDSDDDCGPDGQGYGYYYGEIVDKVFYINDSNSPIQIRATGYLCDKAGYDGLADHFPVVITFDYKTTKASK